MIKLILVEDERIIRNGIEKYMQWEALDIGEVRTCENAEEAFLLCEDYKPDIIISDIRMPVMIGIDFCTKIKKQLPESQIIFISGFSDKEYLKAGISLGAISYVEKPIDIEELSEAVRKAVVSVRRVNRQSVNILHSLLCTSNLDRKNLHNNIQLFECGKALEKDEIFYVSILESKNEIMDFAEFNRKCKQKICNIKSEKEIHFLADSMSNNQFVFLISTGQSDLLENTNFKNHIFQELLSLKKEEDDWFLGIGNEVSSIEMLPQSFKSAKEALKSISYKGWNSYAFCKEERIEYQENIQEVVINRFHKILLDKDEKEALNTVNKICDKQLENHAVLNFYVRNTYFMLDNIISQVDKTIHLNGFEQVDTVNAEFLDQAKTIKEMQEYVCNHIIETLEETEEEQKNNFLIKHLMDHINQNFNKRELTIQALADVVYLSPTYLSNLFKKKTGITVGQYLMNVRIKKAEEFLKNPQLKLYQVAEMVGYEDANYFAKIFKKKTGMLPSEYREVK